MTKIQKDSARDRMTKTQKDSAITDNERQQEAERQNSSHLKGRKKERQKDIERWEDR